MSPFDFVIEGPEDLLPFSDCLEENGFDAGAEAVRWLRSKALWPMYYEQWNNGARPPGHPGYGWYACRGEGFRESTGSVIESVFASAGHSYWHVYHNPTEAVWGFVNAWVNGGRQAE